MIRRIIGVLVLAVSLAIIFYQVWILKPTTEQVLDDPVETVRSGGGNLQKRHDFKPEFDAFEVIVLVMGVAGLTAVVIPVKSGSKI